MRGYSNLQAGLFSWFLYDSENFRSYETIERICRKAFAPADADKDDKPTVYDIFYPLLRWGVVEFYGDNRFRVSPPAALGNKDRVLVCHSSAQMDRRLANHRLKPEILGLALFENCVEVQSSCKESNIAIRKIDIPWLLSKIHPLEQIILSWADDVVIDSTGYIAIGQCSPLRENRQTAPAYTIYKKSNKVYSANTIHTRDGVWKIMPDRKLQIDALSTAVLFCKIYNGLKIKVTYNEEKQVVSIQEFYFPILLERLLFINTMLSDNSSADIPGRAYHLEIGAFRSLNNIFHGAIQST